MKIIIHLLTLLSLLGISRLAAEPGDTQVAGSPELNWKVHHFAMTNWFYGHKWNDADEQIRILAAAGYQGVMLSMKDDPSRWKMLPAYLKALGKYKVHLTAIHCRFYLEDGTYPKVIKDNLALLKDSGVILVPSIGSRKNAAHHDLAATEMVVKILREMSGDARRFGLGGIATYMHIGNWAESIDDCISLSEKVDRDNVGLMFHLHHWTAIAQREAGPGFVVDQAALRAALVRAKPHLKLVVVQGQDNGAATHRIVGEGEFDLRPLVRSLADIGYEGPLGTMGYEQSGDIPGKLARAREAWIKIRNEATAPGYKTDAAPAKISEGSGGKLVATEFAPLGMIGSVVGISVDNHGRVFATHTNRRNNGELDIRQHVDWLEQSLASHSIEDKRDMIRSRKKDWENLFKYKELIVRLADTDGDGKADERLVVHEGFNTEVHGLAGGILIHRGEAFVACIPGFYKLSDRDGDGVMEQVEEIAGGFGIHVGYGGHDMHGPTLGPDGRIYWSMGDKGFAVTENGGKRVYVGHGGVFRIEPDGSGFEVFAHGLRNPQELAFDEFGNLFTVDNDGDFGDRERVHYIAEGSDSGWRAHYQYRSNDRWKHLGGYNPWIAENLWKPAHEGQAAYMTPCIANYSAGPIGFTYNPGTALNEKYRRHFFLAESNKQVVAFQVEPAGAGFRMLEPHTVLQGPFVTGVSFGPEGALYMGDWGDNGWAPHNRGRILKLDDPAAVADPDRVETARLLAEDPAGKGLDPLRTMLRHADQRVRLVAQFELVQRGTAGWDQLSEAARQDENRLARIHGIWGLGQAVRKQHLPSVETLLAVLDDRDPEIRAQAAKVLGDTGIASAADAVALLLKDEAPRVRHLAGIALGRLATPDHLDEAVALLAANVDNDVFVRHAGVMVLAAIAKIRPQEVAALSGNPSAAVRLAAVVGLRRASQPSVATFLDDRDPRVAAEAARAIHDDDSIIGALPQLAAILDCSTVTDPIVLRRAISANRGLGNRTQANRLATFAARADAPEDMRIEAIDTLAAWASPLSLDRVQGFHRGLPPADRGEVIPALDLVIGRLLGGESAAVRAATTRLISSLNYGEAATRMEELASDETQGIDVRISAIETMRALKSPALTQALKTAQDSSHPALRAAALGIRCELYPAAEETWQALSLAIASETLVERRGALAAASRLQGKRSEDLLLSWLDHLSGSKVSPELELDVYLAAKASTSGKVRASASKVAAAMAGKPLGLHTLALQGGNADAGRDIFHTSVTGQCIRCHAVGAANGEIGVGPNLAGIASRKERSYFLRSIIDPSGEIADGYALVTFTLKNGEERTGCVSNENDRVILLKDGTKLNPGEVVKRTRHDVSAMPSFSDILTMPEIRDLVAYLESLK